MCIILLNVYWCQNKLTCGIVLLVHIYTLLHFNILYRTRQLMLSALLFYEQYYFLPLIHVACIQELLEKRYG